LRQGIANVIAPVLAPGNKDDRIRYVCGMAGYFFETVDDEFTANKNCVKNFS
jgi:hypothetical protein